MTPTPAKTRERAPGEPYLSAFDKFEKGMAASPPWLRSLRRAGMAHFTELGFPTVRQEEWRYTNVAPIARLPFRPALRAPEAQPTLKDLQPFLFDGLPGHRLVFLNGHLAPSLSTVLPGPPGFKLGSLAAALASDGALLEPHLGRQAGCAENAFVALNTAFLTDGAFVVIPAQCRMTEPIHLLHVNNATENGLHVAARNLIIAEPGSEASVIEHYVSLGSTPYLTNAVTEIVVGENAFLEHCKIQRENHTAFHVATIQARQERNSRVLSHSISTGARLARNNINLVLAGEGIDSILNGLYVTGQDQLVDHHTVADHTRPHCHSHEFYHGILGGRSKAVFNGKIFVRKDAQKTDAKQTNKNLLLTDEATIDTKPQLEIFADDVKCTHGATIGQLDDEAVFYLRSRGIGLELARNMLIHAFASDILNRIRIPAVREGLDRMMFDELEQHNNAAR